MAFEEDLVIWIHSKETRGTLVRWDSLTAKGNGQGMKSKDKRNETLELHTAPVQPRAEKHTPGCEEVRLRAYEIYIERGGLLGNELDDWLQTERELERAELPQARRLTEELNETS